ncbi:COMM domain-containing protein 9-like [Watersipora subatra]|uniref:COMM domain-containing protein 9-like n=1 Tax=Watersipora subatra TaxID=2589382 RepID=UPI00355B2482
MTTAHPPKAKTVWQHLLKVPSKEVMVRLCDQAILYKGLASHNLPDSIVANWSSTLSVTKGETRQVITSLSSLLQRGVFLFSANPSAVSNAFPDDFHADLRELLSSIIAKRFSEWKVTLADSNRTLPMLIDVQCKVNSTSDSATLDALLPTKASCVLQLKIEGVGNTDKTELIDVELSREKVDTMLDGLSKIRDQLTSAMQR